MGQQPLLIVEDSFDMRRSKRGLVVAPFFPMEAIPQLQGKSQITLPVLLKFPNGTSRSVQAQFQVTHFTPGGFKKICSFCDLSKDDLPIGTEIWLNN